jgi:hypothetical protein
MERCPLMLGDAGCHVSLMKVDVEGMEVDVMRGASRLIALHRPVLFLENDRVEGKRKRGRILD